MSDDDNRQVIRMGMHSCATILYPNKSMQTVSYCHHVAAVLLLGYVHDVLACTVQQISNPTITDLHMNQELQTPFIVKGE